MAGDQPAKHALVSFYPLVCRRNGEWDGALAFYMPLSSRGLENTVDPDGDSFLVLGQRRYLKTMSPLTLKPVLLSEDDAADDNPESQEMLEEQLVRLLTREVMDLISK